MAEKSKISWTDSTFNPWIGCSKVSPGCLNCYAETATPTRIARNAGRELWGKGQPRQRTSADYWKQPLKWNKQSAENAASAARNGGFYNVLERGLLPYHRPRVFCASLADWLDDEVPIEWLADLLDLIRCTPHLDWQLLTKRPQNWRGRLAEVFRKWRIGTDVESGGAYMTGMWLDGHAPANVWLGTTVEDQTRADERIPLLLSIPAKVRFLSCEPLLGPVDLESAWHGESALDAECWGDCAWCKKGHPPLHNCQQEKGDFEKRRSGVDWVICGGESGLGARPMNLAWAESLREQCASAGVPYFMKQLGSAPVIHFKEPYPITDKKGDIMAEWPESLRVQQFPEPRHV